jgi:molybdopterin synthase catalytic subunit
VVHIAFAVWWVFAVWWASVIVVSDPSNRWTARLGREPLTVGSAADWVGLARCGAIVTFSGTTRDHSRAPDGSGRTGVQRLDYEAYEQPAVDRMARIAMAVCERWPDTGRVWIAHRLGEVDITETSVVVAVSAPHRPGAFEAARFAIDQVKATVPIWKREYWDHGQAWASDATDIAEIPDLTVAPSPSHGAAHPHGFDSSPTITNTGGPGTPTLESGPSRSKDSGWAI